MIGPKELRAAYETFKLAACCMQEQSQEWVHCVACAATLGWILGEQEYVVNTEDVLKELRNFLKDKTTIPLDEILYK